MVWYILAVAYNIKLMETIQDLELQKNVPKYSNNFTKLPTIALRCSHLPFGISHTATEKKEEIKLKVGK